MSKSEGGVVEQGEGAVSDHDGGRPTKQAVYHVGNREGRVDPHGEDLNGREILARVGLSVEKYELWTVVHGRTGEEIKPDQVHHVKPGDHYRATIRGTDYSSPDRPLARDPEP
jgi:hypothetical protein